MLVYQCGLHENYMQLSRKLRMGLTDAFIFKCSKIEFENIFNELIEDSKTNFEQIVKQCSYMERCTAKLYNIIITVNTIILTGIHNYIKYLYI